MKKYYLIDASNYIFRAYYAIPNMRNNKGLSTNALYGFIKSVQKIISDFQTNNVIAVFDGKNNRKKRCAIYPEYKANRTKTPEDLPQQIEWARNYCELAGIPTLYSEEDEADDVIGSFTRWASDLDFEIYICSADKDLCQLVNDKVFVLQTYKNNLIVDKNSVIEKFGVPPEKIIDYLAITGDASDNIPGLSGFGPKTAAMLLQQHHSLEEILENPHKINGKKKQETLVKEAEIARISKKLVTINQNLQIPLIIEDLYIKKNDPTALHTFLQEMNFNSLLKEFDKGTQVQEIIHDYHTINDSSDLANLCEEILKHKEICFSIETDGHRPVSATIAGISFCFKKGVAYYIPFNGNLHKDKILELLKPLFGTPSLYFYGHNIKNSLHALKNHDITIKNICFDTALASYLLNANINLHSLDHLSTTHLNTAKTTLETVVGKGKNKLNINDLDIAKVKDYCCENVDYTWQLKQSLSNELKEMQLEGLMCDLEIPLMAILMEIERNGIYIDMSILSTMSTKINASLKTLKEEIYALAGEQFNISSPKQLSEILFTKLNIPYIKKTASGYSTNADTLKMLQTHHPIVPKVLQYRTLEKLRSTYLDKLPDDINPDTKRIHCSFNQSVTATGRLSCQNPNLQNIPVRNEIGRQIRAAFVPQKNEDLFLSADYSQIELRLLAHFCNDENMIAAFHKGEDIHTFTASKIFNIPIENVTKEHRYQAKTVNFGIIYGQEAFGLSRELGISIKEAKEFIEIYFLRYPKIRLFVEECKVNAKLNGYAETLFGRKRKIPEINSSNKMIRANGERLAVNTVLQGTAADIIKMAMLKVFQELKSKNLETKMILQIHDELLFETAENEIEQLKKIIHEQMENSFKLKIPLVVDISVGKNWKDC